MHERPKYNARTKRLEKFDYDYEPSSKCKRVTRKVKRTFPVRRKAARKKKSTPEMVSISAEFAKLTHDTLHEVLTYFKDLSSFNSIVKSHGLEENETRNLKEATFILEDACVLYCLANDVSKDSLGEYLRKEVSEPSLEKQKGNV